MKFLHFLLIWSWRVPARFSIPFILLMLVYLLLLSQLVETVGVTTLADLIWRLLGVGLPKKLLELVVFKLFWEGLVVGVVLLAGILVSYNLAAKVSGWTSGRPRVIVSEPVAVVPGQNHRLDGFQRIGIILAGGGAKGAYQAGAMKAIYEFLEENNALHRVKMIAGTSIGSWNAMFWLSDLVKPPAPRVRSTHEEWWRSVSISRIVEFDTYWPLRRNHFLLPTPWRETFREIFVRNQSVRNRLAPLFVPLESGQDPPIHFYFTRSNVARGHLEFSTNWPGIRELKRLNLRTMDPNDNVPVVKSDRYEVIEGSNVAQALDRTEQAIFASMDLPPLFPYVRVRTEMVEWFEDGGVVDNIPVWFGTQIENCDLLFVFPLNASFNKEVDQTSITKRIFRVMDIRQGVLERNAFKLAYLYNELAAARKGASISTSSQRSAAERAVGRGHKLVSVFAICPGPPLAIGTTEFWKAREAGVAFELMYAETGYELRDKFEEATNPNWIRMAIVDPNGGRIYSDDF